ncbi:hypothetical protein BC830DRAFT_915597 [Chytriomyces sp. MP71]|nr:hypothetical protein BC830DRAFT_915597 [Chytriomyces sp. MP71]
MDPPSSAGVTAMIIVAGTVLGLCTLCFCSCGVAGLKQIGARMLASRREASDRAKALREAAAAKGIDSSSVAGTTSIAGRSSPAGSSSGSTASTSYFFSEKMRQKMLSIHGPGFSLPTSSRSNPAGRDPFATPSPSLNGRRDSAAGTLSSNNPFTEIQVGVADTDAFVPQQIERREE